MNYANTYELWSTFQKKLGNENPTYDEYQEVQKLINEISFIQQNGRCVQPKNRFSQKELEEHLEESSDNTIDSYINSKQ